MKRGKLNIGARSSDAPRNNWLLLFVQWASRRRLFVNTWADDMPWWSGLLKRRPLYKLDKIWRRCKSTIIQNASNLWQTLEASVNYWTIYDD